MDWFFGVLTVIDGKPFHLQPDGNYAPATTGEQYLRGVVGFVLGNGPRNVVPAVVPQPAPAPRPQPNAQQGGLASNLYSLASWAVSSTRALVGAGYQLAKEHVVWTDKYLARHVSKLSVDVSSFEDIYADLPIIEQMRQVVYLRTEVRRLLDGAQSNPKEVFEGYVDSLTVLSKEHIEPLCDQITPTFDKHCYTVLRDIARQIEDPVVDDRPFQEHTKYISEFQKMLADAEPLSEQGKSNLQITYHLQGRIEELLALRPIMQKPAEEVNIVPQGILVDDFRERLTLLEQQFYGANELEDPATRSLTLLYIADDVKRLFDEI